MLDQSLDLFAVFFELLFNGLALFAFKIIRPADRCQCGGNA